MPLGSPGWDTAALLLQWESDALHHLDERSGTAEEFEALAAEWEWPESHADRLNDMLSEPYLDLDLGVVGLTAALAAADFIPTASCRGHVDHAWLRRDIPYVRFAADPARLQLLTGYLAAAGCGLIDSYDGTVEVIARSARNLSALAALILGHQADFDALPPMDVPDDRDLYDNL